MLDLTDGLWRGRGDGQEVHPVTSTRALEEVAPGIGFIPAFGNVSAFAADARWCWWTRATSGWPARTSARFAGGRRCRSTRWCTPTGTSTTSSGWRPFEEEAEADGRPRPTCWPTSSVPARFDRYMLTAGYNGVINARQFKMPRVRWPTEYRYPDETYRLRHDIDVGGIRFELHHGKGETDDHTWVWLPERQVLCTGDLFIWASPNCGNPQKVQRYPREWAMALRDGRARAPSCCCRATAGRSPAPSGSSRRCSTTADLLDHLVDETLAMMNAGARLDDIVHTVQAPDGLLDRPYLRPVYDEPEFVVRNLWRLYGGWYDGNPAHLKPAPTPPWPPSWPTWPAAGRWPTGPRPWPLRATCGWPATWPRWPPRRRRGGAHVRGRGVLPPGGDELSTMSTGVFSWAADESQAQLGELGD